MPRRKEKFDAVARAARFANRPSVPTVKTAMRTPARWTNRLILFGVVTALAWVGFLRAQNDGARRTVTAVLRAVAVSGDRVRLDLATPEGVPAAIVSANKFETTENRPFDPAKLDIHDRLLIYLTTPLARAGEALSDVDIARVMVHRRPASDDAPN